MTTQKTHYEQLKTRIDNLSLGFSEGSITSVTVAIGQDFGDSDITFDEFKSLLKQLSAKLDSEILNEDIDDELPF